MVDSAKQRYTFEVVTAAAFHIGDNHYDLAMLQTVSDIQFRRTR